MREMKDSGVEWIGEIPKTWDKKRLKAVLCERNESNNPIKTDFILSSQEETTRLLTEFIEFIVKQG